jgi:hypothetical protein
MTWGNIEFPHKTAFTHWVKRPPGNGQSVELPSGNGKILISKLETQKIRVECYSGYRAEETPRRFWLGGTSMEVKAVVGQWRDPDHRYFKVAVEGHAEYILCHDSVTFEWALVL